MLSRPTQLSFDCPTRLTCWQWGDPAAPRTALCVHGLTRNGRDFDLLAQDLAACGFRVLCPDMPGRGKSEWLADPAGYNNASYIARLLFMLDALGIAQVDWIGTSMGGIIGLQMANAKPGLIQTLMLNDVGLFIPASGMSRIRAIADLQTEFPTREQAEAAFRKRTAGFGITDDAHWQHLLTHAIEPHAGGFRFTYDPAIFTPGRDQPTADVDLRPLWGAVKSIPVLLIRGAESDILPRDVARSMQETHPNLTLVEVPHCGHAPALMDQGQIDEISNWLKLRPLRA